MAPRVHRVTYASERLTAELVDARGSRRASRTGFTWYERILAYVVTSVTVQQSS